MIISGYVLFLVKKKDKQFNLVNAKESVEEILSGKMDNKDDAKKEFLKKIAGKKTRIR